MSHSTIYSFLITILYLLISQSSSAQTSQTKTYKLFINLEKAPFDSLYLHDYTEGRNILITGKKTKSFNWEITIPDSIVLNSENMELLASRNNVISNSSTSIRFITRSAGKEIIAANVGVDDENSYIYGTYLRKLVFPDQRIRVTTNNKDTAITGNIICEDFNVVVKDAHSDLAVRSEDPFFSWYIDPDGEHMTYESHLASYIALAKKHPDSRFLITYLAGNLTRYKSKEDVGKVYESFSGKRKNTIWAKKIERFLYDQKFLNTSLPTIHKNVNEYIVQDKSRYNLMIFTASWCAPCRAEIPLLKKIYKDLGKHLILTYISIDNAKGVAPFQKLIREQHIPWRSLFAYQGVEKIKQRYFIEGVPHNTLIYPDQHMEIMDVRRNKDLAKLYSVVKSPGKQKRSIR